MNVMNWFISLLESWGYFGIFILMALESFIIPLPAEIILIPAGFIVFEGNFSLFYLILISTLGSLAGSLLSYFIAFKFGRSEFKKISKKYKKIPFWNVKHLSKSESFFKKYGFITVFVSRFIPIFRYVISFPAGFSKMNLLKFSFYTFLGVGIYNSILILLGYFAGAEWNYLSSNPIIIIIFILLVLIIGTISYRRLKKKFE